MIEVKTPEELDRMRRAGRVVGGLLEHLKKHVRPGMKTKELDDLAIAYLKTANAKSAFLGYRGYPASICVSVNEEVVHGIPGERRIAEGDVVSIDAGAVVSEFYGDAAITVIVGQPRPGTVRFGIVREFVGHGIGRAMHEDPPIPNFGAPNLGPRLRAGMVLAIEPMVTMGGDAVEILRDGWTAVTKDRSLAAHFEHTVAVAEQRAEVLTARDVQAATHTT
jgi:methionyl aminopeptidase